MLSRLRWLGLETADPTAARAFYDPLLVDRVDEPDPALLAGDGTDGGGDTGGESETGDADDPRTLVYRVGGGDPETRLVLRRPDSVPRGGVHTHYALAVPEAEYPDWRTHLAADHPVAEHDFGMMQSLYVDDPDGHCVELAGADVDGPGIDGVFEVVLEVRDLGRARSFYQTLGYEPTDEGGDRVRLSGPAATPDLELWEPRLGIADARGGLHVDLGYAAPDPGAVGEAVSGAARSVEVVGGDRDGAGAGAVEDGGATVRVVDPDGHHLTFVASE